MELLSITLWLLLEFQCQCQLLIIIIINNNNNNNNNNNKREIGRLWGIRHLEVVPFVVGALGVVSNRLDAWLEKLGVTIRTGL